jgi:phospholipid/cholesterol/gamma-HCH transport system substrate-binding protein
METSPSVKIKTGLFALVGVLVILLAVYIIGRQQKIFSKSITAYADFRNVSGLQVGNFVRFAGINVGIIDVITIVNDTTVRVQFSLEMRMKPFMKNDAVASINSEGLMGDKLVQIAPGTDSAGMMGQPMVLKTTNPVELDKIISKINVIADNAQVVMQGLEGIVDKINNGHGSIGMLLQNDTLARRLAKTVSSATETVGTIRTSAQKFNENMDAAKHNFLLRGYFKKKEKQRVKDSTIKSGQENSTKSN